MMDYRAKFGQAFWTHTSQTEFVLYRIVMIVLYTHESVPVSVIDNHAKGRAETLRFTYIMNQMIIGRLKSFF